MSNNNLIAIIDSGIGGISVLASLIKKYGSGNYLYFADNLYMPYGSKNKKFLESRVEELIEFFNDRYNASQIIIACNTASSVIDKSKYKNVITMDFDKNNLYLVTPLTKKNVSNKNLIADNNLATLIENNIFNDRYLENLIHNHIKKKDLYKYESIILGCTHYELVTDIFKRYLPNVIANSKYMLENLNFNRSDELNIIFLESKQDLFYEDKMKKVLKKLLEG